MCGQILIREPRMAEKSECLTIEQAMKEVKRSKGTFYTYLNYLEIQRHKFAFDRKSYITKFDLERIKKFIAENEGEQAKKQERGE